MSDYEARAEARAAYLEGVRESMEAQLDNLPEGVDEYEVLTSLRSLFLARGVWISGTTWEDLADAETGLEEDEAIEMMQTKEFADIMNAQGDNHAALMNDIVNIIDH